MYKKICLLSILFLSFLALKTYAYPTPSPNGTIPLIYNESTVDSPRWIKSDWDFFPISAAIQDSSADFNDSPYNLYINYLKSEGKSDEDVQKSLSFAHLKSSSNYICWGKIGEWTWYEYSDFHVFTPTNKGYFFSLSPHYKIVNSSQVEYDDTSSSYLALRLQYIGFKEENGKIQCYFSGTSPFNILDGTKIHYAYGSGIEFLSAAAGQTIPAKPPFIKTVCPPLKNPYFTHIRESSYINPLSSQSKDVPETFFDCQKLYKNFHKITKTDNETICDYYSLGETICYIYQKDTNTWIKSTKNYNKKTLILRVNPSQIVQDKVISCSTDEQIPPDGGTGDINPIPPQISDRDSPPNRADYADGLLGSLEFGFDTLIYYIKIPFVMLGNLISKLVSIVDTNIFSSLNSFLKENFSYIPAPFVDLLILSAIVCVILKIFKR